ncbi:hypothetical protein CK203_102753 [Vitis vinifera]|uniref:Retrotransposon gag domain-containing protein n=1 Tax=Vitis vinifera TaxID=29760 RepID=A0A438FF98_VITVI|nr:hypothetical protein CK203_102753 [Vitis vinifera]
MYSAPYRAASDQTHIVPLLPTFHGMESENPYAHIKEFEDVCNTFQEGGASIDLMRLKLFPFTLKDKAKIWLNSLRPRSIRTWTDLQAEFLKKFFPTHRTNGLKRQISNFSAKENEKFYECWERYMEAIMLVLTMVLIHGYWRSGEDEVSTECFNAKAGMYTLNEDVDMKAKFAAMTRRLEELELKKIHEVQAVAETPVQVKPCPICQSYEHLVEECPTIPAARKCLEIKQMSLDNSSPTTMLRMEILTTQVGGIIQIFLGSQEHLNNLQYSISRLTNLNTVQEKGRFPSQPHQNPKGIHEVETHEGESSQVRDVKALITLRSGKKVELPTPKPHVEEEKKKRQEKRGNQRKEERYQ